MDKALELREKLLKKARQQIAENLSGDEAFIVKAVSLMEDLDGTFNLLAEHAIDWHSFEFPELKKIVRDNDALLELISKIGERKNFSEKNVSGTVKDAAKASTVAKTVQNSSGAELDQNDIKEIQALAKNALEIKSQRMRLAGLLEEKAKKIAPNTSILLGALLFSKLVARAGSMKKLAFMPSSTIQVIGAEKALYSHLKSGSSPPKHGIIFQHPLISSAKPEYRGKMARLLAAKTSIAVKVDYFGGKPIGKELKEDMDKKSLKALFEKKPGGGKKTFH
ncbi:MAG: NOP5/NOP56 family protein, partial [archaeon]|nr:NOP5/NOP56 family protein [archaeon]